MKTLLVTALLFFLPQLHATDIYKTTDKNGNVAYTDAMPAANEPAEKVELKPLTKLPPPPHTTLRSFGSPVQDVVPTTQKYQHLTIVEPARDATIRNGGNFIIRVAVSPELFHEHRFQLKINGVVKGKPQRYPVFIMKNTDRGTQNIEVSVLNDRGKVVKSATTAVHVHRTALKPATKPVIQPVN